MDITAAVNAQQQKLHQHQQPAKPEPEPEQHQQPHMMECNTAAMDPTMMTDPRIIVNLLATERTTMPTCDYFRHVQPDILPFMRKVVTTWMLEVGLRRERIHTRINTHGQGRFASGSRRASSLVAYQIA